MNTENDLKYRLLRLFPVATLKDHFTPTIKTHVGMLEELKHSRADAEIVQFAFSHLDFTKQHIFVFQHDANIGQCDNISFLEAEYLESKHEIANGYVYNYLYSHDYEVHGLKTGGNYEKVTLTFRQPIRIIVEPEILRICFTILERNPKNYLEDFTNIFHHKRDLDDKDLIEIMTAGFIDQTECFVIPLDLNKGVKDLWNSDIVDARSLKYRRESSVVSEVMDEEFTFKDKYPDKFAEIMAVPLRKHIFHFLGNPPEYCDFECDPTEGIFSFNKYPTTVEQINNVVSKIIASNV